MLMRWLPLLLILSLSGLVGVVLSHHSNGGRRKLGWRLLILAYLTTLGVILFTPISFDGSAVYIMPAGTGRVNLTRLAFSNLGFAENVLLTLPLGLLIKRALPRTPLVIIAILGLMIGGSIEVAQHYLSIYWLINRSSDINDVLANGIGVTIGGGLMGIGQRVFVRPRSRRQVIKKAS